MKTSKAIYQSIRRFVALLLSTVTLLMLTVYSVNAASIPGTATPSCSIHPITPSSAVVISNTTMTRADCINLLDYVNGDSSDALYGVTFYAYGLPNDYGKDICMFASYTGGTLIVVYDIASTKQSNTSTLHICQLGPPEGYFLTGHD